MNLHRITKKLLPTPDTAECLIQWFNSTRLNIRKIDGDAAFHSWPTNYLLPACSSASRHL